MLSPSSLNGNFAQLHYTICNPVWFISLPIGNLELLFSLFFPVTIMETLNVTGLHVFYFPHFSALTNAHNLISRQVITSEKQVVYFGFFKDDNFHLDKWSKGVLMFG